ncbi:hypothetical protein BYT27DRAFT_7185145 [Phlegmacium glaucopus]|nr:hypothetical protein BYT27DRAFT_7185145 [Phlegmacium glaucopus]
MSTTSLPTRLVKALEILMDRLRESVSETDIIIFVIGSTGAGKSTFINTAISDDVMVVNHTLATCADDVESIRCTSPWNPSGRTVIFVEIPAFNHSDPTIQKKIPELITRWLTSIYCKEKPIECGILYLHSMASPRMNEDFRKHLDPFVKLCHASGHRPISALLVSTMWPHHESEAEVYQRTKDLEKHFEKTATSAIYRIPCSVRFDGSRSSACNAIDVLILEMQKNTWRTRNTSTLNAHSIDNSAPRLRLTLPGCSLFIFDL